MRTCRIAAGWGALAGLSLSLFASNLAAGDTASKPLSTKERFELGRVAFTMNFARPSSQVGDGQLGRRGNGLGPLINDTSCANCHHQGGVGGAGGLESNVLMVGIVTRPNPGVPIEALLRDAKQVHPGFSDDSPVKVLHKFALSESDKASGYDTWRDVVLKGFHGDSDDPTVLPLQRKVGVATVELVQRNTPALFGIGLIDRLRENGGDGARRRLVVTQAEKTPWISGRIPLTAHRKPGWFGARGQVESLESFVKTACANEMGLQVSGFEEVALRPVDDPVKSSRKKKSDSRVDLTAFEADALISFVAGLPRPIEDAPQSAAARDRIHQGRLAFSEMGCADCHVPDLGPIRGIYSDMLLHDMGVEMTDVQTAVPAVRINRTVTQVPVGGGGGYGSSMSLSTLVSVTAEEIPSNPEREWKTPPLWGVRDSYPYLHDGRAVTLEDAIRQHGGEAERATAAFENASPASQRDLITFLESLHAPAGAEPPEN